MIFKLRDYQQQAVDQTIADLESHSRLGLILPTGAGKTEIFIHIVDEFIKKNPGKSVKILSHLSLLTSQTMERFKKRKPDLRVGILQAHVRPDPFDQVIISTMQTSRSKKHVDDFNHNSNLPVGLIIVDECHYLYSDSYTRALSYHPGIPVIGCTATPFRDSALMTNFFDKISFTISLREMIEQNYLVEPVIQCFSQESKDLEQICADIVKIYLEQEKGKKTIVFMKTIADAKLLRNCFEDCGVRAKAVTSEITGDYRDKVLNDFERGKTSVLTTVNVLTAGFDCPSVESIFLPYKTQSPVLYLQRIGRGLRKCDEIGKEKCNIYVFGSASAPSISRKHYEKLNNLVLNKGGRIRTYDTFTEELQFNDWDKSSEIYHWTRSVVDTIDRMRNIGMPRLAELLENKKFPDRYLDNIQKLLERLPKRKTTLANGQVPASPKQKDLLSRHGFSESMLKGVSKSEASQMISAIIQGNTNQPFVIRSGVHFGKHVSELPHAYRTVVKKKFPKSAVAQQIRKWEAMR